MVGEMGGKFARGSHRMRWSKIPTDQSMSASVEHGGAGGDVRRERCSLGLGFVRYVHHLSVRTLVPWSQSEIERRNHHKAHKVNDPSYRIKADLSP